MCAPLYAATCYHGLVKDGCRTHPCLLERVEGGEVEGAGDLGTDRPAILGGSTYTCRRALRFWSTLPWQRNMIEGEQERGRFTPYTGASLVS